jgi:POT family proton-dependent oligopeptide transporter
MPIVVAWIADEFLGRLKTIYISIAFVMTGHIILIVSALPPVVKNSDSALGCFCVGLVIYGMGVGGFKYVAKPLSTTPLTV